MKSYRTEWYEIELEHDCVVGCGRCSGSGEGSADGQSCTECGGTGTSRDVIAHDKFDISYDVDKDEIDLDYRCAICLYEYSYDEIMAIVKLQRTRQLYNIQDVIHRMIRTVTGVRPDVFSNRGSDITVGRYTFNIKGCCDYEGGMPIPNIVINGPTKVDVIMDLPWNVIEGFLTRMLYEYHAACYNMADNMIETLNFIKVPSITNKAMAAHIDALSILSNKRKD